MSWTYRQASGVMSKPDGSIAGTGYSGMPPTGKNIPTAQNLHMIGPIPCGGYSIGPIHNHPTLGLNVMALTPDATNEMFGRSGFFCHGDSSVHPGRASEGCIVMPGDVRSAMGASADRRLEVTE